MTPPDPIAARIDTLTDIIFGLHVGAHMRRRLSKEEYEQLTTASESLGKMLADEKQHANWFGHHVD